MTEAEFIDAAFTNPTNRKIVDRLGSLGCADAWLVSGALFQSVWNLVTARPPYYGIRDYDIFYFDADLSWEAEDAVIRRASRVYADLGERVEIRNQARVHLWYRDKFGAPYSRLRRATHGIDRFLMTCAQVGIGRPCGAISVYAPAGFDDIERMVVRPNRTANFQAATYYAKALRWREVWPEITVISP